ncbi:YchJ family metal-binding protein, partial [Akkermansiaceae bacterium]|nr:YchJ family metal-binding protein [Akkermansiaceae bacterium]MDB4383477.1 YchJ family metal-binding protein [Akkermansiaceae bacterium]MDB4465964.1 YchJ family metal-binding protein [Akkermansiaceae bacterium]
IPPMPDTFEKIPKERHISLCPCKSKKAYQDCCLPFHQNKALPKTAEALMRSRYSAFFFRLSDYLVETTHPDSRSEKLQRELEETIHHTDWKFLTIVSTSKGQEEDKRGKVEFIADYYWDGEVQQLHEHSRFRRHQGNWKYYDDKG